jgi:hypothetical protein
MQSQTTRYHQVRCWIVTSPRSAENDLDGCSSTTATLHEYFGLTRLPSCLWSRFSRRGGWAGGVPSAHTNCRLGVGFVALGFLLLARCEWIGRRENVLALGNSGTGKTHIGLALGLAACQQGFRVRFTTAAALVHELIEARDEKRLLRYQKNLSRQELLIVDELGFVPLSKAGAEMLFEILNGSASAARLWWPAWALRQKQHASAFGRRSA